MNKANRDTISLREYSPLSLPKGAFSEELAQALWEDYGSQVAVELPSFKNGHQWQLTSLGWVGFIPLAQNFGIELTPKVPLGNLFRMLEYAYRLKMRTLEGLMDCQSLEEFYERLANILARRVLDRIRKGLYRAYVTYSRRLPFLRGRMDLAKVLRQPWDVDLRCRYENHTADVEDNQILAFALLCISRSGACSERVLPNVRKAFRALQGTVTLCQVTAAECYGRVYNRLNDDYEPLHALCRFFLEHSGPSHERGDRRMLPFLIDMGRLFELFVAEWLEAHLPEGLSLQQQEHISISEREGISFRVDLVLRDAASGNALLVLDTKYKAPKSPSNEDISQVVTYAEATGSAQTALIYPVRVANGLEVDVGKIRLRTVAFNLENDLERSGQQFLREMLSGIDEVL